MMSFIDFAMMGAGVIAFFIMKALEPTVGNIVMIGYVMAFICVTLPPYFHFSLKGAESK